MRTAHGLRGESGGRPSDGSVGRACVGARVGAETDARAGARVGARVGARDSGFSLLEVLVAMMVLSIGAASVLSLFAAAAGTHKRSLDRTRAALIAERVISEVDAQYRRGRTAADVEEAVRRAVPEVLGDYRWELATSMPGGSSAAAEEGQTFLRTARSTAVRSEEESDFEPERDAWLPDELIVRVAVRWKRSGSARAEEFFTVLLPHGVDPEAEARRRTRDGLLLRGR